MQSPPASARQNVTFTLGLWHFTCDNGSYFARHTKWFLLCCCCCYSTRRDSLSSVTHRRCREQRREVEWMEERRRGGGEKQNLTSVLPVHWMTTARSVRTKWRHKHNCTVNPWTERRNACDATERIFHGILSGLSGCECTSSARQLLQFFFTFAVLPTLCFDEKGLTYVCVCVYRVSIAPPFASP